MNKIKLQIKKCLYCNKDIAKLPAVSQNAYSKRKFCSSPCQHKWNALTKSKDVICDFCGKTIRKKKSHIMPHNFCSLNCMYKHKTLKNTKTVKCAYCGNEFRKRNSQNKKTKKAFCSRKCMGEWQAKFLIGENSYNWKDGICSISHRIRSLVRYSKWVQNVFKRDKYTCQKCGDNRGGNLEAHHINKLNNIIRDNNLKEIIDVIKCKELWDLNNGITLCKNCHKKEHNIYEHITRAIQ